MATDSTRRRCLQQALGAALLPWAAGLARAADTRPLRVEPAAPGVRLAATWECLAEGGLAPAAPRRWQAGLLAPSEASGGLQVLAALDLPTRAHGVWRETNGALLIVARRPGLWLMRWRPGDPAAQTVWSAPGRQLNGHALASADGRWVYTTEIDHATGEGLLVQRDATGLAPLAEWPTGGQDPHQILALPDGSLLVANGGIRSRPETGRARLADDAMDSSLVRLDGRDGRLLGRWTVADPRLSLRHLSRHGASGRVGVSIQAEHVDPAQRMAAPLLAVFDGERLELAQQPQPLAGYGGDLLATEEGFTVCATQAGQVARWSAGGHWLGSTPLAEACAIARPGPGSPAWIGGMPAAGRLDARGAVQPWSVPGLRLDNHWVAWTA